MILSTTDYKSNPIRLRPRVFVLYSCAEWSPRNTLRLVCASRFSSRIKKAIIAQIAAGNMEYSVFQVEGLTRSQQVERFKADWKNITLEQINEKMVNGRFDCVFDGVPIGCPSSY